MCFCFAALPGNDGDVQDEESEAGGGGVQPGLHPGPPLLFRHGEKDVCSADPGDPQSGPLTGNKTLAARTGDRFFCLQSNSSLI